jgi:hypothetical protein
MYTNILGYGIRNKARQLKGQKSVGFCSFNLALANKGVRRAYE